MTYQVLNDLYEVEYVVKKNMVRIITKYHDGKILMSGPYSLKDKDIVKILDKSRSFLIRCKPKSDSSNLLNYFGVEYPFNVILSSNNYVIFSNNEFNIFVRENEPSLIKKVVSSFYKDEIKKIVEENLHEVLSYYDLNFIPKVDYSYAKGYLGECFFNKKHIRFSGYLAKCDKDTVLQTMHHEICHFYVHSHNQEFKSLLYSKCKKQGIIMKKVKKFNDLY